jgi:hypothetical protein
MVDHSRDGEVDTLRIPGWSKHRIYHASSGQRRTRRARNFEGENFEIVAADVEF